MQNLVLLLPLDRVIVTGLSRVAVSTTRKKKKIGKTQKKWKDSY